MSIDKKLVRTAVATALLSINIDSAVSSQNDAATPTQLPQVEQKPTSPTTSQATEATKSETPAPVANQQLAAPKEVAEDFENKVLAVVNGESITGGMLNAYFAGRTRKAHDTKMPSHMQTMALNNLISIKLLAKAAHESGLESRPGVMAAISLQREQLLAQMLLQERAGNQVPSEEALKKAYAEKYAAARQEYKASHILVKTEDEAKKIIEQLGSGADFATLAKEKSIDPSSKKGGDLGWFESSQMVQTFSDAVATMNIGTYSTKPVQSQFGWHVIKLEDKRAAKKAPEFDSVRPRLQSELQRNALTQYIEELRSKAKIEMKDLPNSTSQAAPYH